MIARLIERFGRGGEQQRGSSALKHDDHEVVPHKVKQQGEKQPIGDFTKVI